MSIAILLLILTAAALNLYVWRSGKRGVSFRSFNSADELRARTITRLLYCSLPLLAVAGVFACIGQPVGAISVGLAAAAIVGIGYCVDRTRLARTAR